MRLAMAPAVQAAVEFCRANSSRPTGSFRQRAKTRKAARGGFPMDQDKEEQENS